MQPQTEFLTPEECAEVDKALLTSQDKFATRVAIYALRSLKQIALENGVTIAQLTPAQIEDWVYQDESLQKTTDQGFRSFFSQLVIASQKPLKQTADAAGLTIEELTLPQVIAHFEQQARQRLEQQSGQ